MKILISMNKKRVSGNCCLFGRLLVFKKMLDRRFNLIDFSIGRIDEDYDPQPDDQDNG